MAAANEKLNRENGKSGKGGDDEAHHGRVTVQYEPVGKAAPHTKPPGLLKEQNTSELRARLLQTL